MGVWGSGGGSEFQGYDYVQTGQPANPTEGQTWYDVDGDAAFVYDGAAWVEMTVTDHGQLSGITADQHHTRPTSTSNDGATDDGWVLSGTASGRASNGASPTVSVNEYACAVRVVFTVNERGDWSYGGATANLSSGATLQTANSGGNQSVHGSGHVSSYNINLNEASGFDRDYAIEVYCLRPAVKPHGHSV